MKTLARFALSIGAAAAFLAACGGSQSPGVLPESPSSSGVNANNRYSVIHSFKSGKDGATPLGEEAPLIVVRGTLYGTTQAGGGSECGGGCGTVFEMPPLGSENVLYSFNGGSSDGINPAGTLVTLNRVFYGTTALGGNTNNGIIFSVDMSGREHLLYSFKGGEDGAGPFGRLLAFNGKLYGTTVGGGKHHQGTVFSVTPSGDERVLYSFKFHRDGANPYAGLTALKGLFYGTTINGGAFGGGTVFAVSTSGVERLIYSFGSGTDGAGPQEPLIAVDGNLYGTTTGGGGPGRLGTVFVVTKTGSERVLHSFKNDLNDGGVPQSALLDVNGTLYGTTWLGGRKGDGVIFSLTMSGKEHILHNFKGGADGRYPTGGLVAINNTLYGTTMGGGKGPCYNGAGCGAIFALAF